MKTLLTFAICVAFATQGFAQDNNQEVAPSEVPAKSVIDQELTPTEAIDQPVTGTVIDSSIDMTQSEDPTIIVDSNTNMDGVMPIQNTMSQNLGAGCGCQQTSYNAASMVYNPAHSPMYSQNRVYSGNRFVVQPTPVYRRYTTAPRFQQVYRQPMQQNFQYQTQFPARQYAPMRRGILPRFGR